MRECEPWKPSLRAEIVQLRQELTARIEALEFAVRKNSADIQQLKDQLGALTDAVLGKIDAQQFRALEDRVAKLEALFGV